MMPQNFVLEKDVAIIGAGPSGLFAVFQCGMMGLSCVVFDSLEDIGGQCTALYPEKPIYDIPSRPNVTAENLIRDLEHQAAPFKPIYCLNQQIVSLRNEDGFWHVSSTKQSAKVRVVIIAAGAGAFGPNKPPLENLDMYEGRGVQYMVGRKDDLKGKRIVIAGGGDSAVDWAIALSGIAQSVDVVHRRDKFRAAPESVQQLKILKDQGLVLIRTPYQLASIDGDGSVLKHIYAISEDGAKICLEADILLLFYGLSASLGPILDWSLEVENHQIPVDPATAMSCIEGIYAIGDIAAYKNKQKLILTGFHEAAMAAHAIRQQIHPDTQFHHEHSTRKGVPSHQESINAK